MYKILYTIIPDESENFKLISLNDDIDLDIFKESCSTSSTSISLVKLSFLVLASGRGLLGVKFLDFM